VSKTKTYRLNEDALQAIREMRRLFKEQVGHDPGSDDPCAFDPDSDAPQPEAEAKIKSLMGDIADRAGLSADLAYAIRKTGLLVTHRNQPLLDDDQLAAWEEALAEYEISKWIQ
jgi:hypothetical protein